MTIFSKPVVKMSKSDIIFYIVGYGLALSFCAFVLLWTLILPSIGLLWFLGVV